jgi:hypothetical protein
LLLQTCPDTQLASVVQATKQRAPLQANGAHAAALAAMHAPVALHVPGGV